MDYNNITKIKNLIALLPSHRTNHVMDGEYLSNFNGQSLEFDQLGEYHYGDNIRDIDWKASSAHDKTLVRRYLAARRNRLLLIGDCGLKMSGHTPEKVLKSELASEVLGAFAWLFSGKGCDYAMLTSNHGKIGRGPFHCGTEHLLSVMNVYEENAQDKDAVSLGEMVHYAAHNFQEQMFVVMVTDLEGLSQLNEADVNLICARKDLIVVCISDLPLSAENTFDVYSDSYMESFMVNSKRFQEAEKRFREQIYEEKKALLLKNRAAIVQISHEDEIIGAMLELFQQMNK